MEPARIERLGPGDGVKVEQAAALFDDPPSADATARFLAEPGHHLLLAWVDQAPAGFVTGVETTHPDKGTEMFVYELAVAEPFRRRGIGRALVAALAAVAREAGCYGMWVLTDDDNHAALATYQAAGAVREGTPVMLGWDLRSSAP
jgi:ribosomal protein S18 acetylase RimI-like enzyme